MMIRRVLVPVLVLALPTFLSATELVTNGDFESDLPPAWETVTAGSAAFVTRSTAYDGDPDYEVLAEKGTGNGHAKVNQILLLPATDAVFSVNAMMQVDATTGGPWAAAGVALEYGDPFGNPLGTTVIVNATRDCPWMDTDTIHLIPVPDELWHAYQFNFGDELANLPGVDPLEIRQVRISLFAQSGGDC